MHNKLKTAFLIPTYCGARILEYQFVSFSRLSSLPDLILYVVKPCPNKELDSEKTIEKYKEKFNNKIIVVKYYGTYGLIKQILLGLGILNKLGIDIVIFLDDDSYIVDADFVDKYSKWYFNKKVGGVAGQVIDAEVTSSGISPLKPTISLPPKKLILWRKPAYTVNGKYIPQTYFTRGGYVAVFGNDSYYILKKKQRLHFSLLGGGSNMSIRLSALNLTNLENLLPNVPVAMRYEQILAYHIAKRGYLVIKDYDIKVYHIFRREGETRAPRNSRRSVITLVDEFNYYYLKKTYRNDFSIHYKIIGLLQRIYRSLFVEYKKTGDLSLLFARMMGHLFGNVIGIYWYIAENKDNIYNIIRSYEVFISKLVDVNNNTQLKV